jgi:flagellin
MTTAWSPDSGLNSKQYRIHPTFFRAFEPARLIDDWAIPQLRNNIDIADYRAPYLRERAAGQKDRLMSGLTGASIIGSENTIRNLSAMHRSIRKTSERVGSGKHAHAPADDASGVAASEQMRAQAASLTQQIVNLDNVINRNRHADSHLVEMEDHLIDMREVAIAAEQTGGLAEDQIDAYQGELNLSSREFNQMVDGAVYGESRLLDGSANSVADIERMESFDLSDISKVESAIKKIDESIAEIHQIHARLGASISQEMASLRQSLAITHKNLVEAESDIDDADAAREHSYYASRLMRAHSSTAILAQGNLVSQSVFGLVTDT